MNVVRTFQRKPGELRQLAAVSRAVVGARLAQEGARVNAPQRGDFYRIDDLAKTGGA